MNSAKKADLVERVVRAIAPLLAGLPPEVQSAAIADLTAIWLAGHPRAVRHTVLDMHRQLVDDLVALRDLEGKGNPG